MTTHQDVVNALGFIAGQDATAGAGTLVFQAKNGFSKFHSRPNADGYVVEVKSEPTVVTGTHFGIETTVDAKPSTATSQAGVRGVGGVCRLAATYTMTGGSLIGTYGQVCNLGTINGSGAMVSGMYSLIEDGGTYTAVSRVSSLWVDSHLDQTVTAGVKDMVYITNNGDTTFDNAIEIYAGDKITNLLSINTASGMVGNAVTADYTFTKTRKIKITVDGVTCYLIADEV